MIINARFKQEVTLDGLYDFGNTGIMQCQVHKVKMFKRNQEEKGEKVTQMKTQKILNMLL